MHLALATWNVQDWVARATFGYEDTVDWKRLKRDLEDWMIAKLVCVLGGADGVIGREGNDQFQCEGEFFVFRKAENAIH